MSGALNHSKDRDMTKDQTKPDYAEIVLDAEKLEAFIQELRKANITDDVSVATASGREKISSRAYAVARHKTAIDNAGKEMTEEWRKQTTAVNERRRIAREGLEALQADIRRPVDEWEKQEEARKEYCRDVIARIDRDSRVLMDDTAEAVAARLDGLKQITITKQEFAESFDVAKLKHDLALQDMPAAIERLRKQEADKAELDRLRAENEVRERAEAAERQRLEEERLAAEAKAERERIEKERAALARIQAEEAARRAAEDARLAAERETERRLEEQRLAHEAELARIERERQEKEAAEQRQRQAAEAKAAQERAAEEARKSNARLLAKVRLAIAEAINAGDASAYDSFGHMAAALIVASRIPHVKVEF
jgi:hypothetical protein